MKGFLLFLLAIVLYWLVYPITVGYTFVRLVLTDWKGLNDWFFEMAVGVDQFGNVSSKSFFQDFMTKGDSYKFGKVDETISSAIGKNKKQDTLSIFGKMLDKVLNLFESNHSIKSIEYDE